MKLKPMAILTTGLLFLILGAGAASAYITYKMGTLALQGVSQPENNPTRKLANPTRAYQKPQDFKPLDEKTILVKVYNHIHHHNNRPKEGVQGVNENPSVPETSTDQNQSSLQVTDDHVTLEISEITQKGEDLLLFVSLTNDGENPVQFLYSFLEITDEKGERLGVVVEDLPETIPANSNKMEGLIRIPINLVDENKTLSLNLTDYPEQKRNLIIKEIPVSFNSN